MGRARASESVELSDVWLFSGCSKGEQKSIARKAKRENVPAGATVVHEGDLGRTFYFIVDGNATILRNGRKVADLGPGKYFGELSLLDQLPRNATVKAVTDMTLLSIDQRDFEAILTESPTTIKKLLVATASRLRLADSRPTAAIVH